MLYYTYSLLTSVELYISEDGECLDISNDHNTHNFVLFITQKTCVNHFVAFIPFINDLLRNVSRTEYVIVF